MNSYFVVQSFSRNPKGHIRPDLPIQAQNTAHAYRMAERLAKTREAALAFTRKGDPKTGEFEDAELIASFGDLPEEVREAFGY